MEWIPLDYRDDFIRYLEAERNLSPRTVEAYTRDIDQFISFCEKIQKPGQTGETSSAVALEADAYRLTTLRKYLATLQSRGGLSNSSVARKMSAIRSYLKFLAREGVIDSNPAVTMSQARRPP